jgi:Protein CHAPERONE-LIKE PROTEIN OF POR1-like
MEAFFERKNPKFNLDKKLKEASQSWVFQFISSHFETPYRKVVLKNAVAFVALGVLCCFLPKVAISLGLTIYFLYQRVKSRLWAFLYGYDLLYLLIPFLKMFLRPCPLQHQEIPKVLQKRFLVGI